MKCIICGKNSESEYCFQHKRRKPLAVQATTHAANRPKRTLRSHKSKWESSPNEDHLFFKKIWKERQHNSELSNDYLGSEALSIYFHHILPKNKYHDIRMDEENIILLTVDEHANVESDIYKYDEINKRRNHLLKKHNLL